LSFIFHSCDRWHTGTCRNELVRNTFFISESESFTSYQTRHLDLEKLESICMACDFPLKIQRRECPACGSYVLQNQDIPLMEIGTLRIYNYMCSECGRELFSHILV
jgi:ribosomal protein S27AE